MQQNRNNKPTAQPASQNVPKFNEETIQQILRLEEGKMNLAIKRIDYDTSKLANDTELAKLSITANADYLNKKPEQLRKNAITYGAIAFVFLVVILLSIGYCLSTGHKDFVYGILKILLYPIFGGGGYWIGSRSKKVKQDHQDVEFIDQ